MCCFKIHIDGLTIYTYIHTYSFSSLLLYMYHSKGGQVRLSAMPRKAEFRVELGKARSECDISIVDRLHSLLQPQKLATTETMASHMYTSYNKHVSLVRASLLKLFLI